ncbi:hypothetical protein B5M10_25640 [Pluralibacter gergoviae]|nr:hypothetical protein A8H26_25055 [Pluralibacter gergoviae]OUQ90810.1 hypothetical protein B5M10_25640 [Pluralibacter gergoviae]PHH45979.1 hypothetical protein CRX51_09545 [Pluralibacter gergoviae]
MSSRWGDNHNYTNLRRCAGFFCLKFRDVTTVRFRNTPLHFASLLCVFRLVVADASRHNQGPRGIDR